MRRRHVLAAAAVAAALSAGALARAVATAGGVVRPVLPTNEFLSRGMPLAAERAAGRRVLVLHADPGRPRRAEILESGRAPEGWALYPAAPSGAFAEFLDVLAARAAASFDPRTGFPADVEAALSLSCVKAVVVDDAGKRTTEALRVVERAEPVLRIDGGDDGRHDAGDPIALAARLRTSPARESGGWTFSDWEDELWGGAVTVETSSPGRFLFPYPADLGRATVDGKPVAGREGPFLALDLPAGRSRVEVRVIAPGEGETLAVAGAAGLLASIVAVLLAFRPSRADVEAAVAAREAGSVPGGGDRSP